MQESFASYGKLCDLIRQILVGFSFFFCKWHAGFYSEIWGSVVKTMQIKVAREVVSLLLEINCESSTCSVVIVKLLKLYQLPVVFFSSFFYITLAFICP